MHLLVRFWERQIFWGSMNFFIHADCRVQHGLPMGLQPQHGLPPGLWPQHGLWPGLWPQHGLWFCLWTQYGLWPGLRPQFSLQPGLWPQQSTHHGLWPHQAFQTLQVDCQILETNSTRPTLARIRWWHAWAQEGLTAAVQPNPVHDTRHQYAENNPKAQTSTINSMLIVEYRHSKNPPRLLQRLQNILWGSKGSKGKIKWPCWLWLHRPQWPRWSQWPHRPQWPCQSQWYCRLSQ